MQISRRGFLYGSAALAGTGIITAPLSVRGYPSGANLAKVIYRRVAGVGCLPLIDVLYGAYRPTTPSRHPAARGRRHPRIGFANWGSIYRHLAGDNTPPTAKERPAIRESLGLRPYATGPAVLRALGTHLIQQPWFDQAYAHYNWQTHTRNHTKQAIDQINAVYLAYTGRKASIPEMDWCLHKHTVGKTTVTSYLTPAGWREQYECRRDRPWNCDGGIFSRRQLLTPTRAYAEFEPPALGQPPVQLNVEQTHFAVEMALTGAVIAGSGIAIGNVVIPALMAELTAAITAGEVVAFFSAALSVASIAFSSSVAIAAGLGTLALGVMIFGNQFPGGIPGGVSSPSPTYSGYIPDVMSDLPSVNVPGFQGGTPTTSLTFSGVSADGGDSGGGVPGGDSCPDGGGQAP